MKITFTGLSPVDIAGIDDVQPGQTVDVPDDQAKALLFAGSQVAADGTVTAPEFPLWVPAGKSKPTTSPADAGKE